MHTDMIAVILAGMLAIMLTIMFAVVPAVSYNSHGYTCHYA